ncbi:MAG: OstA-like protein, partial [Bacteroidota bacterium]
MAPLSKYLLFLGIAASATLSAQSLQLKRADRFTVVNAYGRSVTKLRGNVKLASTEGVFTCDSADWFRAENRFFAYSNVRFAGRTGTSVRARYLEYLN